MVQDEGFNPDHFPSPAGSMQAFIKQYMPDDDDSGCIAHFEYYNEYKPAKSQQSGSEIFEDVLYIRIQIRGNNKNEVHRPATEADKKRFPYSWQEFQKGELAAERGTNLSKLPGIEPGTVRSYQALNIYTIEDLALVSDNNLHNLGVSAREMRARAVEFVRVKRDRSAGEEQSQEFRATITTQAEQIARLTAMVERLTEQSAKKGKKSDAEA